jgi:hypothetical protein
MESSIERLCILAWKKARGFVTFHMQHVIFLAEIILLQGYDFLLSLKHESFEAVTEFRECESQISTYFHFSFYNIEDIERINGYSLTL